MLSVTSVNCLLLRGGRRGVVSFIGCRAHDVCKPLTYLQTSSNRYTIRRNNSRCVVSMTSNDKSDGDSTISNKGRQSASTSSTWDNKSLVGLLEKTTSRAMSTLSSTINTDVTKDSDATKDSDVTTEDPTVQNVIDAAIIRSSSTLDNDTNDDVNSNDIEPREQQSKPKKQHQDKRTYLGNPSVTPTALAHSLWRSTILPCDTVIDATCGNGKDCLALARMLFPDNINDCTEEDITGDGGDFKTPAPQLIGLDIQSRAIQNTKQSLLSSLPSDIYYDHVSILQQSHEHLMDVPRDKSSIGLVCYNLGYLPGGVTDNYKECQTQTETTLNSITDASLLLRVGGLLSIMTYPGSNLEESIVVEHFIEGLAMLTTRDQAGWRGYLENIPNYNDDNGSVRMLVTHALERVVAEGMKKQTWRSFSHKPLGRPLSPVLVTAMRIK